MSCLLDISMNFMLLSAVSNANLLLILAFDPQSCFQCNFKTKVKDTFVELFQLPNRHYT